MAEEYLENLQVGDNILYGSDKGVVKFVGSTHFSTGVWVGIELDLPSGKNDGSYEGRSYFNAKQNHGLFVRPDKLQKDESVTDDDQKKPKTPKAVKVSTKTGTTKKISTAPIKTTTTAATTKISTTPKPPTAKSSSKETLLSPKVDKKTKTKEVKETKDKPKSTTKKEKEGTEKPKKPKTVKASSSEKLKEDEEPKESGLRRQSESYGDEQFEGTRKRMGSIARPTIHLDINTERSPRDTPEETPRTEGEDLDEESAHLDIIINDLSGWTERQQQNISSISKDAMVTQAQQLLQIASIIEQYGAILSHHMTYAIASLSSPSTKLADNPFDMPRLALSASSDGSLSPVPFGRTSSPLGSPALLESPDDELKRKLKIEKKRLDIFLRKELTSGLPPPSSPMSQPEDLRKGLLLEIQSPRHLRPSTRLRPATLKAYVSPEGTPIHRIQEKVDLQKLSAKLSNRPAKEDLLEKNIIKQNTETSHPTLHSATKTIAQKDRLKKALNRRPSVLDMNEKHEIQGSPDGPGDVLKHKETISYTKASKSHMYDIAMIVVDNLMWCASGDKIRVIDTNTGKIVNMVETKTTSKIRCITEVGDNHQVWSGSHDKKVYVYDYDSKALVQSLKSHNASIRCIQKVGETVWSGSTDGCVCIWDTSSPIKNIKQIQCHTRGVNALCVYGNHVWSGSDDKCLRVTDSQSGKFVKKLQGHMDYINTLATVGNKVWCGSEDKSASIWDAKTYKFVKRIPHDKSVKCIVAYKDVYALTGSSDGIVRVFDAKTYELVRELGKHSYGVNSLVVVGSTVWCAYVDQIVSSWDIEKGKQIISFKLTEQINVEFSFEEQKEIDTLDDDMAPVFLYINRKLEDDAQMKQLMPTSDSIHDWLGALQDGVLLCKFVNAEIPGIIDGRVLNTNPVNMGEMTANTNLHMNACALLGCDISTTSASQFLQKKEDAVFSYVYQLVEACLFANIGRKARTLPELFEEDDVDISKLPSEEILLRWANYHLKAAGSPRILTNFSTDVQDSECYHTLLSRLVPHRWDLSVKSSDPVRSAEGVVANAQKIGFAKYLRAKDIVEGNHLLNIAFVAELFRRYQPAKTPSNQRHARTSSTDLRSATQNASQSQLPPISKEDIGKETWITNSFGDYKPSSADREARSCLSWLNSYKIDPISTDLYEDLRDGIVLLKLLDRMCNKVVDWKIVNTTPDNTFKKTENCNYVIKLCQKMGLQLKGICGKDIEEGRENLTLSLLSQLMRYDIFNLLNNLKYNGEEVTENTLIEWANAKVVNSGKTSKVESFRDPSLKNGRFLCDLLHAVKPGCINYEFISPGDTQDQCMMNAKYVINCAWKIGCNVILLWEDIVEVKQNMILVFIAAMMAYCNADE